MNFKNQLNNIGLLLLNGINVINGLFLRIFTIGNHYNLKDFQIRELLKRTELSKYFGDRESKVVEEMRIPVAKARIDMAVINGSLHGYEIKGSSDTLQRLPNQLIAYSYIFDYLTIVTEEKHHAKIAEITPSWVGISICDDLDKGLVVVNPAKLNTDKNPFHLAKLLWREEIISVLQQNDILFKKKDRNWILCEVLASNMEIEKLSHTVRVLLKKRATWKS